MAYKKFSIITCKMRMNHESCGADQNSILDIFPLVVSNTNTVALFVSF